MAESPKSPSRRELFEKVMLFLVSLPIVGGVTGLLYTALGPIFRLLKPTTPPVIAKIGNAVLVQPPAPEKPVIPERRVGNLSDLKKPWDYLEFVFDQVQTEYTPQHTQSKQIPAFVLRVPYEWEGKRANINEILVDKGSAYRYPEKNADGSQDWLLGVSRICVHLGCIFRFETDPSVVEQGYSFRPPNPVFACPCHFSVYNPLQDGIKDGGGTIPGPRVISGPAPRPPRYVSFRIDSGTGDLFVTGMEEGGVA